MAQEIAVSERFRPCWRLIGWRSVDAARAALVEVGVNPDDYAIDTCPVCQQVHIRGKGRP